MPKLKGRKSILMIGLPIGFALAGAIGFMAMSGGSSSAPPPETPDPSPGQLGPMLVLEEKVINLQTGGSYRYVKMGVTIEMRPEAKDFYALTGEGRTTAETEALKGATVQVPLLLDRLGQAVAAKTSDDLATPEGRAALKTELLTSFRDVLGEKVVLDVFFTDFVMQ